MRKRDNDVLTNIASLIVCGALAGVVVAAAAFPAAAMTGLFAKAGGEAFHQLPSEITVRRAPQITSLYANDGKTLITTIYDENRRDVELADVAPIMRQAIIAAEDQRFYDHNGVDVKGVMRAFVANQSKGEITQGASTITMQYVRLAMSYSAETPQEVVDATADTNTRKIREMRFAMALEQEWPKDKILEGYLNIAYFGNRAFGIYAASQVYFGKPPSDLTLEEAALLAGLVKFPGSFDVASNAGYQQAFDRRNWVLDQMVKTGAISAEEAERAKQTEIKVTGKAAPNGCTSAAENHWGFFCDFFVRWWLEQEAFGATPYERENRLKTGGYTIITSLDPQVQNAAKANIEQYLPTFRKKTGEPEWRAIMLAAVEPGTGKVRALAVNRNFKLDDPNNPQNGRHTDPAKARLGIRGNYPNTVNPLITGGGDITGYQAGSSFKIFTMVAALEKGFPLDYTINATSPYVSRYIAEPGAPATCNRNRYCPVNASPEWMNGPRNMWTGFGRSVNTYFVPLQERVGAENAVDVAKRLGIQFRAKGTPENPNDYEFANDPDLAHGWGAFTLGVSATTPLDLANAYASLAADGSYCEPIPVEEIRDHDGDKLDVGDPRCRQAVKPEVARAAVDAARCPVGDQSAGRQCNGATFPGGRSIVRGYPIAGKTGTTDGDKTATLVMMTKQLAVAGIMADPDTPQNPKESMRASIVNPAVAETLRDAMAGKPAINFEPPTRKLAYGNQVRIPNVTCKPVDEARATLRGAGFDVEVESRPVDSPCPGGTVARTDPSGRTVKGGVVVIYVSNGKGASQPPGGGGDGGDGGVIVPPPPREPGRP
jgi:membrane peptidoglycan carboxypeptidase